MDITQYESDVDGIFSDGKIGCREPHVLRLTDDSPGGRETVRVRHAAGRHLHLREPGEPGAARSDHRGSQQQSQGGLARADRASTAHDHGTNAIMRLTASRSRAWRWQEHYIAEGVDGLMRDKTHAAGRKPLSRKVRLKVLAKTANQIARETRRTGAGLRWRPRSASAR